MGWACGTLSRFGELQLTSLESFSARIGFVFNHFFSSRTANDIGRHDRWQAHWTCHYAEAAASVPTSASCYHVEENIRILVIVKAILKFREIQRQIFLLRL